MATLLAVMALVSSPERHRDVGRFSPSEFFAGSMWFRVEGQVVEWQGLALRDVAKRVGAPARRCYLVDYQVGCGFSHFDTKVRVVYLRDAGLSAILGR